MAVIAEGLGFAPARSVSERVCVTIEWSVWQRVQNDDKKVIHRLKREIALLSMLKNQTPNQSQRLPTRTSPAKFTGGQEISKPRRGLWRRRT